MSVGMETAEAGLLAQMTPILLALADDGRAAVSLGGSRAKKLADASSDYDFRVYADRFKGPELKRTDAWAAFESAWRDWEARGFRIDGVWPREIASVDGKLAAWCAGKGEPVEYEWTIWGYHLPTDIAHQQIVADPAGVLAGWKQLLATYPEPLREAVFERHLTILRYWRTDYHYRNKVERGDAIFLAGLTTRLLHSIMQVLFALNRTYFVGDGWNLRAAEGFELLPDDLAGRVGLILDPPSGEGRWASQYHDLMDLIDDVEGVVARGR